MLRAAADVLHLHFREEATIFPPAPGFRVSTPNSPLHLLFVCVENSNRSQMAEAFAKMHRGDRVVAWSAGSRPSGQINPRAIAAMKANGYDLISNGHWSKGLSELPQNVTWDRIVTMGCGDSCPLVPAKAREDWQLPDPEDMSAAEFNDVRDEIERRVVELLKLSDQPQKQETGGSKSS